MATLFFAREGSDVDRTSRGISISLQDFLDPLGDPTSIYTVEPPTINPEAEPNPYCYTLVVLEIAESEITGKYDRAGYYWFPELTPKQCASALHIQMPN